MRAPRCVTAIAILALLVIPSAATSADGPEPEARTLRCSGDAYAGEPAPAVPALENHVGEGLVCWGHIGTHTYFVGSDGPVALRGGAGFVVPAETGAVGQGAFVQAVPALEPGVVLESSLDGVQWDLVQYVEVPNRPQIVVRNLDRIVQSRFPDGSAPHLPDPPATSIYENKPHVSFTLPDSRTPFRFLRVRQPLSPQGGLSGYLDHSEMRVLVAPLAADAPATGAPRAERDCGAHLLDAVRAESPCFFGATASYFDAPSFTHTYYLGGASRVTAASGSATAHPYRSLATAQQGAANVTLVVEASRAGLNDWVTLGEFDATFGAPARFEFSGLDADAALVRVRAEPHRLFASPGTHHWAGFLVQSTLVLEGDVAPSARGDGLWSDYSWTLADAAGARPDSVLPEAS